MKKLINAPEAVLAEALSGIAAAHPGLRVDAGNKVVFYPIDLVDDTPRGLVLGGIPADVRIIVACQELVADGDVVNPVEADEDMIRKLVGEVTGGTQ